LDDVGKITEKNQARKIFTTEKINKLFPSDAPEVLRIWLSWEWVSSFRVELTCGFRQGEVAALKWAYT